MSAFVPVYLLIICGVPLAVAATPLLFARTALAKVASLALAPLTFLVAYVLTCGLLARLTSSALTAGKMRRDLGHVVYGPRRLHALCWTAVYYCSPVYHAVLTLPWLKWLTFRLFGYRGSLQFTIYPDSWIRDLPLLDIGAGAYIANRATLGSNICLRSGDILVDRITIGARAMVGHMAIVGLGDVIGDDAEIGVGTTLGMNVHVGARTTVGAIVGLNHGARIGDDCEIESMSYVGKKAVIANGIRVHAASMVPDRAVLLTQEDADRCRALSRATLRTPDAGEPQKPSQREPSP